MIGLALLKVLKPFQIEDGIYISKRKSALVAHQPRVGKSGIAIHASDLVNARVVVIVCPAAVRMGWVGAIEDFRTGAWMAFVVSYNKAASLCARLRQAGVKIDVLVVDESQYAKERGSQRTRAIYGSTCERSGGLTELAERTYCLTGTPLPNNAAELWPMLRAIAPELILDRRGKPMSHTTFTERYCKKIFTPFGMKIAGTKNYKELKKALEGFLIRRLRRDVFGRDIQPPTKLYVQAAKEHSAALDALEGSDQGKRIREALARGDGLAALLKEEKQVGGLRQMLGLAKVPSIISIVSDELDAEPTRKQVIFAYHTSVIDALKAGFKDYGVQVFDGRTPMKSRPRMNEKFLHDPKFRVVVCQLEATKVGLDFSSADDALFCEQSWVGDDNEQARARIFNMNSLEPKFTRFAVIKGSLDEGIGEACERKLNDAKKVLGS
jgi:SWI/SNF-related matrix-associated actin-dependent regulator 1 of chromatin subfamily A